MEEADIDMTVLTWHYRTYEKSQKAIWFVKALDGIAYYHVAFEFKGDKYEVIYDEKGFIMSETKYVDERRLPEPILKVLDYRVVKYKIDKFTKESEFENRKLSRIDYRVEVRTKTGGLIIMWFDQDFQLIPENRDDIVIR
jgi:hypothetical protein